MECERLHIEDFNQYYQRVTSMEERLEKVRRQKEKREREITLLKEVIDSQSKLLNGLNLDIGLLAHENLFKARSRSQNALEKTSPRLVGSSG